MKDQKPNEKPGSWSAVRPHLVNWGKPALLALIKDLYESGAANRDFIQARCDAEEGGDALERYRKRVRDVLSLARRAKAPLGRRPQGDPRDAVVAYLRDPARAEVRLLSGEHEVVVHDPDLARALARHARTATQER